MSVNVQLESGLKRIAGSTTITSSKIISALGYTPTKQTDFDSHVSNTDIHVTAAEKQLWNNKSTFSGDYNDLINAPNITEDGSSNLYIADNSGNIIAKVDANGITSVDFNVDNISIKDKIPVWDAKSDFSGSYNDLTNAPNITEDESNNYVIVDNSGNIIARFDANGLTTTKVTIDGVDIKDRVDTHIADTTMHVTASERTKWNNKSEFDGDYNSLTNKPNITDDGSNNLVITDNNNNIIMQVDANGVTTTQVSATTVLANGADVGAHIANKNNPHNVTKNQVGLGSVDNTSDVNKPVSTAQATAIADAKQAGTDAQSNLDTHAANTTVHITDAERTSWNNKSNFSGDYGDLTSAPNITEDESDTFYVVDSNNNIIMQIDSEGIKSSGLIINGENVVNKINAEFFIIKSDLAEQDRLKTGYIPHGKQIPESADLNTMEYILVGDYWCPMNVTVATLTNCPTNMAFLMQVYSPIAKGYDNEETSKWVYRVRKILTYTGDEYIQRVYSDDVPGEFVYDEWKKTVRDIDIPKILNNTALTGTPTAPTAAAGNNSTQLATTEFVQTGLSGKMTSTPASIELNQDGKLLEYGGFIDFHYHNADGVASENTDYSSRIIESADGVIEVNGVSFNRADKKVTATTFNGLATSASKLTCGTVGSISSPIYFEEGIPKACGTLKLAPAGSSNTPIYINSDGTAVACTELNLNAATATAFASAQTVALTGDVTGSASSTGGWSVKTTLANSGVTAGTYGTASSPSHGGTFAIPSITVDAKGRVTNATTVNVTLPTDNDTTYSEATATTAGLMSAADKAKLDTLSENANKGRTLLYTNDNYYSEFAGQSISIDNISQYDAFYMVYFIGYEGDYWWNRSIYTDSKLFDNDSTKIQGLVELYNDGGTVGWGYRSIQINSTNNTIDIGDLYLNGESIYNQYWIPHKIYGIKY